eukprot:TRINITY_DN3341_c0_g1_i13.p1 TRINITY_DN3341_c0_g1~~TRINITY_DN3341_c0_g1_i13.p1  ORF type:complete len:321 (+),score=41.01 TRINITY_DN3341_c0_g1_i13:168-1130(+)
MTKSQVQKSSSQDNSLKVVGVRKAQEHKKVLEQEMESDNEQISKECSSRRSRRRWTQRPDDELKLRQTFNKRRKGLVSKAYQLSYLTQVKVFLFMMNKDKNESWAYATPGLETLTCDSTLTALRQLAGALPQGATHVLENSTGLSNGEEQQLQDVGQEAEMQLEIQDEIQPRYDDESLPTLQGLIPTPAKENTQQRFPSGLESQKAFPLPPDPDTSSTETDRSAEIDNFLRIVFSRFPAKSSPAVDPAEGYDLIKPRTRRVPQQNRPSPQSFRDLQCSNLSSMQDSNRQSPCYNLLYRRTSQMQAAGEVIGFQYDPFSQN